MPEEGYNLKGGDEITVNVTVDIPYEKNHKFSGSVVVINKDNYSDSCTIPVLVTTPLINPWIYSFLEKLMEHIPFFKQLIHGIIYQYLECVKANLNIHCLV